MRSTKLQLEAVLAAVMLLGPAGVASAYEYYECYNYGYDDFYDDDWFYDTYDYNENCRYDGVYDSEYGEYDPAGDAFDWEEDGLFK